MIVLGDDKLAQEIIRDKDIIPATLSMRAFLYDALLMEDKNKNYVIEDILSKYNKMIDNGSTSFGETEL